MWTCNRERVTKAFASYTDRYNARDPKIALKIDHTYKVAALCEQIAGEVFDNQEDIDIAWICGMLHDIGRFEQVKRYGTFEDAKSIDHAILGADLLFVDGLICDYVEDDTHHALIERAIRNHSAYRIEKGLDERTEAFCHILRDADKIDILRVNLETPIWEIYNTTEEQVKNAVITEAVLDSLMQDKTVRKALKQTPIDHAAGHISLVYELVYPVSIELVHEQKYLDQMLSYPTNNTITRGQFDQIREHMEGYLARRLLERNVYIPQD